MKIRNVSGRDRFVPALGKVVPSGGVVRLDAAEGSTFVRQSHWEKVPERPAKGKE